MILFRIMADFQRILGRSMPSPDWRRCASALKGVASADVAAGFVQRQSEPQQSVMTAAVPRAMPSP
jgi:hypothetical protein